MPAVDRPGLYIGEIKDFAVSRTNVQELPQLIVTLLATDLYNEADETWQPWTEFEQTIIGYLVLTTVDENGIPIKCPSYDQVMEAVGWDGETYSSLAAMDLKNKRVQFRVIEDTYEGQPKIKVNRIAAEDADIGLRKLSGKDLTNLDAKFGIASTKKKTAATPKTAKPTAAAKPPKPKPPKVDTPAEEPVEPCTVEEAYDACRDANEKLIKPVPGEVLDDYWVTHVEEIAADTDNITNEEAAKIRNAVLNDIDIPF